MLVVTPNRPSATCEGTRGVDDDDGEDAGVGTHSGDGELVTIELAVRASRDELSITETFLCSPPSRPLGISMEEVRKAGADGGSVAKSISANSAGTS